MWNLNSYLKLLRFSLSFNFGVVEWLCVGGCGLSLNWLVFDGDTIRFEIPPTQSITYDSLPLAVEEAYRYYVGRKFDVIKVTGRGPIWLYSAIVHTVAHLAKAVAVYDAINGVYVIVASHNPNYKIGQTLN
jgi:CRISPR-associated Csx3 family protein